MIEYTDPTPPLGPQGTLALAPPLPFLVKPSVPRAEWKGGEWLAQQFKD